MTRRCSHCSHNGHNSRTCPNKGVKLFGVRLTDGSIRKSASMGNLTHYVIGGGSGTPQNGAVNDSPVDTPEHPSAGSGGVADGYASDDFVAGSSSSARERKKGVPWTEEEHRMFLLGLQKLGKGDWRGISRNYVISRTPTQVASHAQKYFIRQSNSSRRKRRSSLFDIVADQSADTTMEPRDFFPTNLPPMAETESSSKMAPPQATVEEEEEECESMESDDNSNENEPLHSKPECPQYPYPVYLSPLLPMDVGIWPTAKAEFIPSEETAKFVRPLAVHPRNPINVDELVGISNLGLGESLGDSSLKLVDGSSRPSAFHAL